MGIPGGASDVGRGRTNGAPCRNFAVRIAGFDHIKQDEHDFHVMSVLRAARSDNGFQYYKDAFMFGLMHLCWLGVKFCCVSP